MTDQTKRPLALILLDGWGIHPTKAHTPYYNEICRNYPMTVLAAGTSTEAGYRDIAAGRKVISNAERINSAIDSGEFFKNSVLVDAMPRGGRLHLAGTLSGSERHASVESLIALLKMAKENGVGEVYVHGFLDGRDVPAQTAEICVEALEREISKIGIGRMASLCGRFFAMNTDGNWERTARTFTLLMHGEGEHAPDAKSAIEQLAMRGISEEFMAPTVIGDGAVVREGDAIVFFNHRADGMRQLARSISRAAGGFRAVCMTEYDPEAGFPAAFAANENLKSLNEAFALANVRQERIFQAENRGYFDQATSFVPAGDNVAFRLREGASASDEPEMSSFKIANEVIERIERGEGDFFAVSLPAADVLASQGNEKAAIEAMQFIDTCLGGIIDKILEVNGTAIVTSPNGLVNESLDDAPGDVRVPFHLISNNAEEQKLRKNGTLSDIAPTILAILGFGKSAEMSGNDLRSC
jgi:2,3-bisphosphoglycerate-independent phosphoglycerate mutase